jgi:Cdc6-like AAA superfamily ATPase
MSEQSEIVQQAMALSKEAKRKILMSFKEVDLYPHLKSLLTEMDPKSLVEITHGPEEYGKDLVMVREDRFGQTVIAVVVKTGDIRAKTLGKIDEVKSQVNQAIAHPAILKAIKSPLTVSTVWVILAGELSNQARKRLEQEVDARDLKIYDLNWVIEHFTKYYPQVFFEGQVIDVLQEKIQDLETKHLFCKRGKTLSQCFVHPLVAVIDVPVKFDEKQFVLVVKERKMPFSRLNSLLKTHRRIILAGDPGTGKSVALAKLAIDMLRKASDRVIRGGGKREVEIPILMPAIELLDFDNCENLLREYIPHAEIRDRFQIVTMLVDGLDEAPPDRREEVLKKAGDFSMQLNCSLVITARKIDLIKSAPPGFNKYELLPFEFGQALALFNKLVSDSQVLDALKDGLDKIKFQISLTPLSLLLLVELAEDYREIPASITELYERFCDLILGRYDKDKGIEVLFEYLIKKRFLAVFAFKEFFGKERLEIPRGDFDEFLSSYADLYGWDKEALRGFISEIERASVLDFKDTVAFRHRSFLDYFVAQYIQDNREDFEDLEDRIAQIYFDDVWSDVAFFYLGLRRDIRCSLLEKIFANEEDDLSTYIDKLLAGRLLQAAWHSTQETRLFGIERAIEYAPLTRKRLVS